MPERLGNFYAVWPEIDGKPLSLQFGNVRSNTSESKAVVRSSVQDIEASIDTLNAKRALEGFEFGEVDYQNKFRLVYSKTADMLKLQVNDGTADVPSWRDLVQVREEDGLVDVVGNAGLRAGAGFYGPTELGLYEIAEGGSTGATSTLNPRRLFFNSDTGFYLTPLSNGDPLVSFATDRLDRQYTEEDLSGQEWSVNHNLSRRPVMTQVFNESWRQIEPDEVDISDSNITYFYFFNSLTGHVIIRG